MIDRLLLLVTGAIIAFFAAWLGSEMHAWAVADLAKERGSGIGVLAVLSGIVALIGMIVILGIFFAGVLARHQRFDERGDTLFASACAICGSFLFGEIVAPIGGDESANAWVSPWSFLLAFGFLPFVFTVKELIADYFEYRRERKNRTNVTHLRAS